MSYLAASIADACAYTMFRMAGDAPACRLRRRVLQCTMHRGLQELAQVHTHAPHPRFMLVLCVHGGCNARLRDSSKPGVTRW